MNKMQQCRAYINNWYDTFEPKGRKMLFSASIDYTSTSFIDILINTDGATSSVVISCPEFTVSATKSHDG